MRVWLLPLAGRKFPSVNGDWDRWVHRFPSLLIERCIKRLLISGTNFHSAWLIAEYFVYNGLFICLFWCPLSCCKDTLWIRMYSLFSYLCIPSTSALLAIPEPHHSILSHIHFSFTYDSHHGFYIILCIRLRSYSCYPNAFPVQFTTYCRLFRSSSMKYTSQRLSIRMSELWIHMCKGLLVNIVDSEPTLSFPYQASRSSPRFPKDINVVNVVSGLRE